MRFPQGVFSCFGFVRQPSHRISPSAIFFFLSTASAIAALRSKSPPMHSPEEHTKENIDFAKLTLTLYRNSPVRVRPSLSEDITSTFRDFSSGNLSARLIDSLARWIWWRRNSARGLVFGD